MKNSYNSLNKEYINFKKLIGDTLTPLLKTIQNLWFEFSLKGFES